MQVLMYIATTKTFLVVDANEENVVFVPVTNATRFEEFPIVLAYSEQKKRYNFFQK